MLVKNAAKMWAGRMTSGQGHCPAGDEPSPVAQNRTTLEIRGDDRPMEIHTVSSQLSRHGRDWAPSSGGIEWPGSRSVRKPSMSCSAFHSSQLTRRRFLSLSGLAMTSVATGIGAAGGKTAGKLPIEEAFDGAMTAFMSARGVPGGSLAVAAGGRLVFVSGYGFADRAARRPVEPESRFRIASISKPITAIAVLRLVEQGRLSLDARVVPLLKVEPFLPGGRKVDLFLDKITVRHLLQHTGGWDRDKTFDPMFRSRWIAERLGVACPAGNGDIIRFMFGRPLDFEPGTRYAYSNFGYCVLGRVIERVTGRGYEAFVRDEILAPIGVRHMRVGASLPAGRAPGEVQYYTPDDERAESVFATPPVKVPVPDGGFCLETMDAHGGWIASATDLVRVATALTLERPGALLKDETLRTMLAPPPAPVARRTDGSLQDWWYGCGWSVRPVKDGGVHSWHSGSLPGTFTLLVRRADGVTWAALFNQRSNDKRLPDDAIDSALHRAVDSVQEWPREDLFRTAASQ